MEPIFWTNIEDNWQKKKKKKKKMKRKEYRVFGRDFFHPLEPSRLQKRHGNITSSMQITTIHATLASHKQAARRQLGGFAVVTRQCRRRGRRL